MTAQKRGRKASFDEVRKASAPEPLRGRGASGNPRNRFEPLNIEPDPGQDDADGPVPATIYLRDQSKSIIARNTSPDIPFDASVNPYRGCEHGCIYCYARPTHEYLGFSAGLDFETRIMVKENAPELLRKELSSGRWIPQVVAMSGVTDCYQPIERRLRLTRRCLQVFADSRNPVTIVTKNQLVTRDIDVLRELARHSCISVSLSITTLDASLVRIMEPRTSHPAARLKAVEELSRAGIPVGVLLSPVIPGLTDEEMCAILSAAANAGARWAHYQPVRLPMVVAPLFEDWLRKNVPGKADRVLNRIREMHGGELSDSRFCARMQGDGAYAEALRALFRSCKLKAGIPEHRPTLSCENFRVPRGDAQLSFLD